MLGCMDIPRFHVDGPLSQVLQVELSLAEGHHAMHVLRLRPGSQVELFNGSGLTALAAIVEAKHGKVTCEITQTSPAMARPAPVVHLAFAIPKGKRLDWLLEKATELSAASLTPVAFDRSVAGGDEVSENKRDRWLGHCIAAAKQSGLNFLPELREMVTLRELLAQPAGQTIRLVGDLTDTTVALAQPLSAWQMPQDILLIVGPEGGLSDSERAMLRDADVQSIRLGSTVLRIETAAVALLAGVIAVTKA